MGKRSGSRSGSKSSSPAPKRRKADLEPRGYADNRIFKSAARLHEILLLLLDPLFSAITFHREAAKSAKGEDEKYISQLACSVACKAVGQLLCSFSLLTKVARAVARSIALPVRCGFHMRRGITPAQFTAFLHGWTPEYKRTSIVVESYEGVNLAALSNQLLKCEDDGVRVVFTNTHTYLDGRYVITLLPLSAIHKGVEAYEKGEFGEARHFLNMGYKFRFNKYTYLLYNLCMQGGTEERYSEVTMETGLIINYSLGMTSWVRDSKVEPVRNLDPAQFRIIHESCCLDILPLE